MAPSEELRPVADRIARLLPGERGAAVLAELQKLSARLTRPGSGAAADDRPDQIRRASGPGGQDVGIWRTEVTEQGIALRRRDIEVNPWHWADVEYVPPPGTARRAVLIGESVARGWAYDPVLNPAQALARQLEAAAPGQYQCVDLAQAGAMAEDLVAIVGELPALAPDLVIMLAGNNWGCFPNSPRADLIADLAEVVRQRGYPAMREMFIRTVMLPRAQSVVASLRALQAERGIRVIIVIPEFNLRGWAPPAEVEVPVLAADGLSRWYELRSQADRASDEQRWADVLPPAMAMRNLDQGASPVPGQLLARAAAGLGDGPGARAGLESSRDAMAGLGMCYTPRIIREVRDLLATCAAESGFECVDLAAALASPDLPDLPDARLFFDYCHLSDEGIEQAMRPVCDAVLGLPPGTTPPGPAAEAGFRALMQVLAAAQSAFLGQPDSAVDLHLRLALDADPAVAAIMGWLLDALEGSGPMWARPAVEPLSGIGPLAALFGHVILSTNMPPELWTLRACLGRALDRIPARAPARADLIAAPFSDGIRPPSLVPGRAFHQATAQRSRLAFSVAGSAAGDVTLTYRMPAAAGSTATVTVNDIPVGTLGASPGWAHASLAIPASALHPGVNWLTIRWPAPQIDAERTIGADIAAMGRGEYPYVLPVLGELFDAQLALDPGAPPAAPADPPERRGHVRAGAR
jgi:hypothetical protein